MTIEETIIQILQVSILNTEDEISLTDSFEYLGMDSLDFVEFVMACEEEFGIYIDDEDAETWESIEDAVNYVEEKKEG